MLDFEKQSCRLQTLVSNKIFFSVSILRVTEFKSNTPTARRGYSNAGLHLAMKYRLFADFTEIEGGAEERMRCGAHRHCSAAMMHSIAKVGGSAKVTGSPSPKNVTILVLNWFLKMLL